MLRNFCTILIIWGLILSASLVMSSQALALTQDISASVNVSETLSTIIDDQGDPGISFGQLLPGSHDNVEVDQHDDGAMTLTLAPESNALCNFRTRGHDFSSDGNVLPVGNVVWATSNDADIATPLQNDYVTIGQVSPSESISIWYWLSVPESQVPGSYSAQFDYISQAYYQGS